RPTIQPKDSRSVSQSEGQTPERCHLHPHCQSGWSRSGRDFTPLMKLETSRCGGPAGVSPLNRGFVLPGDGVSLAQQAEGVVRDALGVPPGVEDVRQHPFGGLAHAGCSALARRKSSMARMSWSGVSSIG
ncbi:hypothetical protein ABIA32_006198, partial [Streptacidiphilus sp. MAP12-20]